MKDTAKPRITLVLSFTGHPQDAANRMDTTARKLDRVPGFASSPVIWNTTVRTLQVITGGGYPHFRDTVQDGFGCAGFSGAPGPVLQRDEMRREYLAALDCSGHPFSAVMPFCVDPHRIGILQEIAAELDLPVVYGVFRSSDTGKKRLCIGQKDRFVSVPYVRLGFPESTGDPTRPDRRYNAAVRRIRSVFRRSLSDTTGWVVCAWEYRDEQDTAFLEHVLGFLTSHGLDRETVEFTASLPSPGQNTDNPCFTTLEPIHSFPATPGSEYVLSRAAEMRRTGGRSNAGKDRILKHLSYPEAAQLDFSAEEHSDSHPYRTEVLAGMDGAAILQEGPFRVLFEDGVLNTLWINEEITLGPGKARFYLKTGTQFTEFENEGTFSFERGDATGLVTHQGAGLPDTGDRISVTTEFFFVRSYPYLCLDIYLQCPGRFISRVTELGISGFVCPASGTKHGKTKHEGIPPSGAQHLEFRGEYPDGSGWNLEIPRIQGSSRIATLMFGNRFELKTKPERAGNLTLVLYDTDNRPLSWTAVSMDQERKRRFAPGEPVFRWFPLWFGATDREDAAYAADTADTTGHQSGSIRIHKRCILCRHQDAPERTGRLPAAIRNQFLSVTRRE
jgi:hypothetical protein